MVDVWNQYMAGYKKMKASSNHVATLVRYEDLVQAPVQTVLKIDTSLALESNKVWQAERALQEKTKANGKGRQEALRDLREESYRNSFNEEELATLCRLLDKELLQELGYAKECVRRPIGDKLLWMHIPKAGSSFGNALITLSCDDLPDYAAYTPSLATKNLYQWITKSGYSERCASLSRQLESCSGHFALSTKGSCSTQSGQVVGMFRQPEQRILSAFHHTGYYQTMPWNCTRDNANVTLDVYKTWQAGCATRMLTGSACMDEKATPIDAATLQLAKQRLHDFAFVGLQEEWQLSMCLLSSMTGMSCHRRMLMNNRPSDGEASVTYDIKPLEGWRDSVDGSLYEEARTIFYQRLEEYGVTPNSCASTCPQP